MTRRQERRPRPPLDRKALDELALAYVGRFATSRAKLAAYLGRKLRERGWGGEGSPAVEEVADRMAALGYVDDQAYASATARSLGARGYGQARVGLALRQAGIAEEDAADARAMASEGAVVSALRYAQRRRLGPFAAEHADARGRERALASMIRAGHSFALARTIIDMAPGEKLPISNET